MTFGKSYKVLNERCLLLVDTLLQGEGWTRIFQRFQNEDSDRGLKGGKRMGPMYLWARSKDPTCQEQRTRHVRRGWGEEGPTA